MSAYKRFICIISLISIVIICQQGIGGLTDYIDGDFIPDFLGGPAECGIREGRLVPKSLYRSLEFDGSEHSFGSDIYHNVHVSKGSPHEVCFFVFFSLL